MLILSYIPLELYDTIWYITEYCIWERIVIRMSTRERILTIRLMEKLQVYPEYARKLGVEVIDVQRTTAADKKGE